MIECINHLMSTLIKCTECLTKLYVCLLSDHFYCYNLFWIINYYWLYIKFLYNKLSSISQNTVQASFNWQMVYRDTALSWMKSILRHIAYTCNWNRILNNNCSVRKVSAFVKIWTDLVVVWELRYVDKAMSPRIFSGPF